MAYKSDIRITVIVNVGGIEYQTSTHADTLTRDLATATKNGHNPAETVTQLAKLASESLSYIERFIMEHKRITNC